MSNAPKIAIQAIDNGISAEYIRLKQAKINEQIDAYNEAQERLKDKIRGTLHKAMQNILTTYFKLATKNKVAEADLVIETSPALMASYMKQSNDAAARHLKRLVEIKFLVPSEQKPTLKQFNTCYHVNLDFLSTPPSPVGTPPEQPEPSPIHTPPSPTSSPEVPPLTPMAVVHTQENPTMRVAHNTCEQLENEPKNEPKRANFQHIQKNANTLIYSNLNDCCLKKNAAICGTYLIVYCYYRIKDNYKGCGYVDNFLVNGGMGVWQRSQKKDNCKKMTIKAAFGQPLQVRGHLKCEHWGGGRGAAAA
jgi:hypothetical protein